MQTVHNRSRMLYVHRSEYLYLFVTEIMQAADLFERKHCFVLHTMFPTNTKIKHRSVAKFKEF